MDRRARALATSSASGKEEYLSSVTMKELLAAGVHFGHQTRRWNPKMKRFIFGKKSGIYIIDLQKTLVSFEEAADEGQERRQRRGDGRDDRPEHAFGSQNVGAAPIEIVGGGRTEQEQARSEGGESQADPLASRGADERLHGFLLAPARVDGAWVTRMGVTEGGRRCRSPRAQPGVP